MAVEQRRSRSARRREIAERLERERAEARRLAARLREVHNSVVHAVHTGQWWPRDEVEISALPEPSADLYVHLDRTAWDSLAVLCDRLRRTDAWRERSAGNTELSREQREYLEYLGGTSLKATTALSAFDGEELTAVSAPPDHAWPPKGPPAVDPHERDAAAARRSDFLRAALTPFLDKQVEWDNVHKAVDDAIERAAEVSLDARIREMCKAHYEMSALELFFPLLSVHPLSVLSSALRAPEVARQVETMWSGDGIPPREGVVRLNRSA